MTPAPDFVLCTNCHGWFAATSLDDFFYHATAGCCREHATQAAESNDSR
jgi:hypothetical protein